MNIKNQFYKYLCDFYTGLPNETKIKDNIASQMDIIFKRFNIIPVDITRTVDGFKYLIEFKDITIKTRPKQYLGTYYVGLSIKTGAPYIEITFLNRKRWLTAEPQPDLESMTFDIENYRYIEAYHPHVDRGGKPCWGSFQSTVFDACKEGNIFFLFKTIEKFLMAYYGRSVYHRITEYRPQKFNRINVDGSYTQVEKEENEREFPYYCLLDYLEYGDGDKYDEDGSLREGVVISPEKEAIIDLMRNGMESDEFRSIAQSNPELKANAIAWYEDKYGTRWRMKNLKFYEAKGVELRRYVLNEYYEKLPWEGGMRGSRLVAHQRRWRYFKQEVFIFLRDNGINIDMSEMHDILKSVINVTVNGIQTGTLTKANVCLDRTISVLGTGGIGINFLGNTFHETIDDDMHDELDDYAEKLKKIVHFYPLTFAFADDVSTVKFTLKFCKLLYKHIKKKAIPTAKYLELFKVNRSMNTKVVNTFDKFMKDMTEKLEIKSIKRIKKEVLKREQEIINTNPAPTTLPKNQLSFDSLF